MPDDLTSRIRARAASLDTTGTPGAPGAALVRVVDAVLELHAPLTVCAGCEHPTFRGLHQPCGTCWAAIPEVICGECCTDIGGCQTEECADDHPHYRAETWCGTVTAIATALGVPTEHQGGGQ